MKTLKILSLTSSILMVSYFGQPAFAQLDLENEDNRIAYSIGANIGQNLLAQQVVEGLDIDAFLAGMEDAIAGNTQLDQEAMMQAIQTFMQRQAEEEAAALHKVFVDNFSGSQKIQDTSAEPVSIAKIHLLPIGEL